MCVSPRIRTGVSGIHRQNLMLCKIIIFLQDLSFTNPKSIWASSGLSWWTPLIRVSAFGAISDAAFLCFARALNQAATVCDLYLSLIWPPPLTLCFHYFAFATGPQPGRLNFQCKFNFADISFSFCFTRSIAVVYQQLHLASQQLPPPAPPLTEQNAKYHAAIFSASPILWGTCNNSLDQLSNWNSFWSFPSTPRPSA